MKNKTKVIIGVVLLVLVVLVGSLIGTLTPKHNDCFSTALTFACDVQKYEQKSDKVYLTFEHEFSNKKFVKSIAMSKNEAAKTASENIKDIIGITVEMNVPKAEIQKHHFDSENPNLAWFLFEDGMFDNYCEIVDISFNSNSK